MCVSCDVRPKDAAMIWAGIGLIAAGVEATALRRKQHHYTFSHLTRYCFRTHTSYGRIAFGVAWSAFSAWYAAHIIISPHNKRS